MNINLKSNQSTRETIYPVVFVLDATDPEEVERVRLAWYGSREKPLTKVGKHLHQACSTLLAFYFRDKKWLHMRYFFVEFDNEDAARNALLAARLSGACMQAAFRFTQNDRRRIKAASSRFQKFSLVGESLASLEGAVTGYIESMRRRRPKSDIFLTYTIVRDANAEAELEACHMHVELSGIIQDMKM